MNRFHFALIIAIASYALLVYTIYVVHKLVGWNGILGLSIIPLTIGTFAFVLAQRAVILRRQKRDDGTYWVWSGIFMFILIIMVLVSIYLWRIGIPILILGIIFSEVVFPSIFLYRSLHRKKPTVQNEFVHTTLGVPVEITLRGRDPYGHRMIFHFRTSTSNGHLDQPDKNSSKVFYTPNPWFAGTDSFRFYVRCDKGFKSEPATVSISVDKSTSTTQVY